MANFSTASRFPTTDRRAYADEVARICTRPTYDGKLVARVVEVAPNRFAVLIDKNGKPFGSAPLA